MHDLFVTINTGCDNFMLPVGDDRSVCMNSLTINMICGLQVGGKQCMHELCVTINIVVHSELCDNSVLPVGGDRSVCVNLIIIMYSNGAESDACMKYM